MIKRIAMWRLHKNDKAANLDKMKESLLSLAGRIPSLEYVEVGTNISNASAAYDIVFIGHFKDKKALAEFEADEYHRNVGEFVSSIRVSRVVVDYEL